MAGHGSDCFGHQHKEADDIGWEDGFDRDAGDRSGLRLGGSPQAGMVLLQLLGSLADERIERPGEERGKFLLGLADESLLCGSR